MAIGFVLFVTVGWWGFAFWSIPGAPEWLARARSVCFNLTDTGLPDAKGWLLLVGQPPAMLAVLFVAWTDETVGALRRLAALPAGRALAFMVFATFVTGGAWVATTVRDANATPTFSSGLDEAAPATYPRLDREWPYVQGLVDQTGAPFDHTRLSGRPALVTFAFGNCETVCPAVVHRAREVRHEVDGEFSIVVYTLDPWRDTPSTLPRLVDQFMLDGAEDFLVSGPVDAVEAALDAWDIPRVRDERTGDVSHPALVYLVESDGTVAYASSGGPIQLASLAERLNGSVR